MLVLSANTKRDLSLTRCSEAWRSTLHSLGVPLQRCSDERFHGVDRVFDRQVLISTREVRLAAIGGLEQNAKALDIAVITQLERIFVVPRAMPALLPHDANFERPRAGVEPAAALHDLSFVPVRHSSDLRVRAAPGVLRELTSPQ